MKWIVIVQMSGKVEESLQSSLTACCEVLNAAVPSSTVHVLSILSPRLAASPRSSRAHTPVTCVSLSASLANGVSPERPAVHSASVSRVQTPVNHNFASFKLPHSSDPAVDRSDLPSSSPSHPSSIADEVIISTHSQYNYFRFFRNFLRFFSNFFRISQKSSPFFLLGIFRRIPGVFRLILNFSHCTQFHKQDEQSHIFI